MTSSATLSSITRELVEDGSCSLTQDQLTDRRGLIRREIEPRVVARADLPDGVTWEFDDEPGIRQRLEQLAELERECCGGALEFAVRADVETGRVHFEIRGAMAHKFQGLALEPAAAPSRPASTLRRLAKAVGVGGAVSFFVCCIVPLGVATLAGVSIAGPLLQLDTPWIIGSSAGLIGVGVWLFDRHSESTRATRDAQAVAGSGCGC